MARSTAQTRMGVRRFGRFNWLGLATLCQREIYRFLSVWSQTLAAPVVTAGLFMAIFVLAFGAQRGDVNGQPFAQFLAPGILMLAVIQNAFANTSSSIMISKVQGNIIDTLMPPLSPLETLIGYTAGGAMRGLLVAISVAVAIFPVLGLGIAHPIWAFVFVMLGAILLSILGILAGVVSTKFDHMSAITNFVITPLAFLSGTFYSFKSLPEGFQIVATFNPFYYLIDGTRYAVLGQADGTPGVAALVVAGTCLVTGTLAWAWFRSGFRLKS